MSSSPPPRLDRRQIRFRPLRERQNKFQFDSIAVDPDGHVPSPGEHGETIRKAADSIRRAREKGAPVMLCHGAHLIKNGLAPLLIRLVEEGWITLIATNGAGSIHDWEFGFQGKSCEDVRANVSVGEFGIWEETGAYLGLANLVGGLEGLGYGEAVGKMMVEDRLVVPPREELVERLRPLTGGGPADDRLAACVDLLDAIDNYGLKPGTIEIPHGFKRFSIQHTCYERGVPFTVHPGIGQDIIYSHPLFRGGAIGRASLVDFLTYAGAVHHLENGVYLSVGSSVMSPMIFEKSLSMSRNIHLQEQGNLERFTIVVNDLAEIRWDWSIGEPPPESPAYYVRFMKSFSRMGGTLSYVGLDNRIFLLNLYHELRSPSSPS